MGWMGWKGRVLADFSVSSLRTPPSLELRWKSFCPKIECGNQKTSSANWFCSRGNLSKVVRLSFSSISHFHPTFDPELAEKKSISRYRDENIQPISVKTKVGGT
jgi:hypothetical protein